MEEQSVDPIGAMDADLSDVVDYREVYGIPQEDLPKPETTNEKGIEEDTGMTGSWPKQPLNALEKKTGP